MCHYRFLIMPLMSSTLAPWILAINVKMASLYFRILCTLARETCRILQNAIIWSKNQHDLKSPYQRISKIRKSFWKQISKRKFVPPSSFHQSNIEWIWKRKEQFVLLIYWFFRVNASEPLRDLEFAIVVSSPLNKEIKNKVEKMGGTVVGLFVTSKTAAVISDVEEVTCSENKMKLHIKQAKIMGIQVVSADKFFEAVKNDDPFNVIKQMNIAKWPCKDVSGGCSSWIYIYIQ